MDKTNDSNSSEFGLAIYRIVFSIVMIYGIIINKKLYTTIKKQITGERGKVFQKIMKSYALLQAVGWPLIWLWMLVIGILPGHLFPPCVWVNCVQIGIFAYLFLRTYVGFNSLVQAAGRYLFVVHDAQVLEWGVDTVGKVLIRSSFIIPFVMAVLANSVVTLEFNGWLSPMQEHASSCYSRDKLYGHSEIGNGTAPELFKSLLYDFLHSNFPTWFTSGIYFLNIVLATILLSNVCEGIIYTKCAIFVLRSECKETVLACLSEESKIKRRRRNTIGIQIAAISWAIEFIGGSIALVRYWLFQIQHEGEWVDRICSLFDFFVCMIPIPLSYLLNEEAVKLAIEVKGWSSFLYRRNEDKQS